MVGVMKDVISFIIAYALIFAVIVLGLRFLGAPDWFKSSPSEQECYVEYGGGIGGSSEIICY